MKISSDYRAIARDSLRGNWPVAVLTGFVAALLGGVSSGGGNSNFELELENQTLNLYPYLPIVICVAVVAIVWGVIVLVYGGAIKLGYCQFNLDLVDRHPAQFDTLFYHTDRKWQGFLVNFLTALYTFLWALLFVIPGIMKAYSYAMAPYILAENPEMTADDAIRESQRLMRGNRFRLFCLQISFIGWNLLCAAPPAIAALVFGIIFAHEPVRLILFTVAAAIPLSAGTLFLRPYEQAAEAAFYRDISYTEPESDCPADQF